TTCASLTAVALAACAKSMKGTGARSWLVESPDCIPEATGPWIHRGLLLDSEHRRFRRAAYHECAGHSVCRPPLRVSGGTRHRVIQPRRPTLLPAVQMDNLAFPFQRFPGHSRDASFAFVVRDHCGWCL